MEILVGDEHINCTPVVPYDERVCDMLDAWATEIRGDSEAKAYPDVLTFGFFIRRGSISRKRKMFMASCGVGERQGGTAEMDGVSSDGATIERRLGCGLAFHIAPSNIPVNCMYTLVFGLLSGCANIVRVSSKDFPQVEILCRTLLSVLKKHKFAELADRIQVLRYDRDEKNASGVGMTEFFSSICDVRIIWGGDDTIADIRKYPLDPRAKEITFADRYSIGVLSARAVAEASDEEISKLASNFYNDTYLMDQNACSTPQLIAWKNDLDVDSEPEPADVVAVRKAREEGSKTRQAQDRFWAAVARVASERYDLADIKVSEKFADLCENAARDEFKEGVNPVGPLKLANMDAFINSVKCYEDNVLYVCDMEVLTYETIEKLRGKYGLFFQYVFNNLLVLKPVMDHPKIQTCAVYGIETSEVAELVVEHGMYGVDRVVPFGKTLDIDVVWDGYDLVREMSRIVVG